MRAVLAIVMIGFLSALGGCASGQAYAPQPSDGGIGYSDEQLSSERYRVTFSGDIGDSREQVESYLLRRAAEVTLRAGFTHFVVDKQNTETKVSHRMIYEAYDRPMGTSALGVRSPPAASMALRSHWQQHFLLPRDLGDVTRYVVTSEIVLLGGEELERNPNAISARDVLEQMTRPG
jgi:hypothetical protein